MESVGLRTLNQGKGLVRYLEVRKTTGGRPPKIVFLTPDGEEAYRARMGRYPDRRQGESPNHRRVQDRVIEAMDVENLPHRRFDILYHAGDEGERGVEVETGSNNNEQIVENLVKSIEFQDDARFVCVDRVTYNRVLQLAARHTFTNRAPVTLRLTTLDALEGTGEWDVYRMRPVPTAPR